MGIHCEISLFKPENGAFVGTAGTVVSGLIKYAVDEETVFNNITVSLKGIGSLHVEKGGNDKDRRTYHDREVYIDIDDVIHKEISLPIGAYDIPFKFEIPQNVPPTLAYRNWGLQYHVKCNITYYVRIKFNKPGFLNFTKRFKKEITIISGLIPRLPTGPVIYGGQKKLKQLFTRHQSIVNIKANILNSMYKSGDEVELIYEVTNNTNLAIKAVETKLVEINKFFILQREITRDICDIPETSTKTGAIKIGETQEMSVKINIPSDKESAEFSKLYSRDYFVFIIIHLPIPHRNYVLEVPIQIGNIISDNSVGSDFEVENPPSYWEAMNEDLNNKFELNEKN